MFPLDHSPLLKFLSPRNLLLIFFISSSLLHAQLTSSANKTLQSLNFKPLTFVSVDDLNNEADSETGFGAVTKNFQIGTYQVTAAQYALFLNAVASKENRYHLYDERMTSDPDVACLSYNPVGKPHYKPIPGREDFPITYVDLFCAVRFCNWISNGCPWTDSTALTPDAIKAITETGAYTIHTDQMKKERVAQWIEAMPEAPFFIPNENQWYKAAYYHHDTGKIITYDPDDPIPSVQNQAAFEYWNYPTQSMETPWNSPSELNDDAAANFYQHETSTWWGPHYTTESWSYCDLSYLHSGAYLTPVGKFSNSPGPYGTFDMAGNVNEWIFSDDAGASPEQPLCAIRGGSWQSDSSDLNRHTRHLITATTKNNTTGFRIACEMPPATTMGAATIPPEAGASKDDMTRQIIQNTIAGNQTYQMIGETAFFFSFQEACEMALVYEGAAEGCMLREYLLKMTPTGLLGTLAEWAISGPSTAVTYALQWGIHMALDSIGLAAIDAIGTEAAAALAKQYGLGTAVEFYERLHEFVHNGLNRIRGVD